MLTRKKLSRYSNSSLWGGVLGTYATSTLVFEEYEGGFQPPFPCLFLKKKWRPTIRWVLSVWGRNSHLYTTFTTGDCSGTVPHHFPLPRILLLSRKLLRTHIARILLGFGLATCVVADRIPNGSDLRMRVSICIASISSRVYLSMVYIERLQPSSAR